MTNINNKHKQLKATQKQTQNSEIIRRQRQREVKATQRQQIHKTALKLMQKQNKQLKQIIKQSTQ